MSEHPSILPILQKIPVFKELTEEDHREILPHIVLNYFPADQVIFNKGDSGDKMYIIKEGQVMIFDPEETRQIAVLNNNDFFGEMALVSNDLRNASVKAMEDSMIFTLHKDDFRKLISSNPNMASKISTEYIQRQKENQDYEDSGA